MIRATSFGFVLALVALAGCSETKPSASIQGEVIYNGKPVFPGTILLKPDEGRVVSANLTADGKFIVSGIASTKYRVAIQTQKLANVGGRSAAPKGEVRRREDTVPDKFKNANVDIPGNYRSFDSSPLQWDFSSEIPSDSMVIDLGNPS